MPDLSQIINPVGERLDISFQSGAKMGALVILGHGVTGNKDRPLLVAVADGLVNLGWPCLRISYSGNGESEGDFRDSTISKEIEDLKSVLKTVPQEYRVAYIGHSMGGAVGVMTAANELSIQCLVSLAGMTHTKEFVEREFGDVVPDEGLMWEEEGCPLSTAFVEDLSAIGDTLSAASQVIQPWLLIHGTADDVVPLKDSIDAHEAARCQKRIVEIAEAGHVFGEESYGQVIDEIHSWLTSQLG